MFYRNQRTGLACLGGLMVVHACSFDPAVLPTHGGDASLGGDAASAASGDRGAGGGDRHTVAAGDEGMLQEGDLGSPVNEVLELPEPLARYWVTSRDPGPATPTLHDAATAPFDLPILYRNNSPALIPTPLGAGHLVYVQAGGYDYYYQTGGPYRLLEGSKINLHNASQATIAAKFQMRCTDMDSRVVSLASGTSTSDQWLTLRAYSPGAGSLSDLEFWGTFKNAGAVTRISAPMCSSQRPVVMHWVVDTAEFMGKNRVRAYLDGRPLTTILTSGNFPDSGSTFKLDSASLALSIGAPHPDDGRPFDGRIYYGALYDTALDATQVWLDAARLQADDDSVSDVLVVSKSVGTDVDRDFATLGAWEAARDGDLMSRRMLWVSNPLGTFIPGEAIMNSGCGGIYVPENSNNQPNGQLSLDDFTGGCTPSTSLVGETSGARVLFLGYLGVAGTIERAVVHNDEPHYGGVVIDGSITDAAHYMWIAAAPGEQHLGRRNTGVHLIANALAHGVHIMDPYTRVDGLEISGWALNGAEGDAFAGILVEADHAQLSGIFLHSDGHGAINDSNADGIRIQPPVNAATTPVTTTIDHCFIFNIARSGIGLNTAPGSVLNLTNTTLANCTLQDDTPEHHACVSIIDSPDATVNATNVIAVGGGNGFHIANSQRATWGDSSHNLTSDGSAPEDLHSFFNVPISSVLGYTSPGGERSSLKVDSPARDAGTATSPPQATTDINYTLRPGGIAWDIGADEYDN